MNENIKNENKKNKNNFSNLMESSLEEDKEFKKRKELEESGFFDLKLPLMNLCIETLSFLSLHFETKQKLAQVMKPKVIRKHILCVRG